MKWFLQWLREPVFEQFGEYGEWRIKPLMRRGPTLLALHLRAFNRGHYLRKS